MKDHAVPSGANADPIRFPCSSEVSTVVHVSLELQACTLVKSAWAVRVSMLAAWPELDESGSGRLCVPPPLQQLDTRTSKMPKIPHELGSHAHCEASSNQLGEMLPWKPALRRRADHANASWAV